MALVLGLGLQMTKPFHKLAYLGQDLNQKEAHDLLNKTRRRAIDPVAILAAHIISDSVSRGLLSSSSDIS